MALYFLEIDLKGEERWSKRDSKMREGQREGEEKGV